MNDAQIKCLNDIYWLARENQHNMNAVFWMVVALWGINIAIWLKK